MLKGKDAKSTLSLSTIEIKKFLKKVNSPIKQLL